MVEESREVGDAGSDEDRWRRALRQHIADQLATFWFARLMVTMHRKLKKIDDQWSWGTVGTLLGCRNQFHRSFANAREVVEYGRYCTPGMPGLSAVFRAIATVDEICRQAKEPRIPPSYLALSDRAFDIVSLRGAVVYVETTILGRNTEPLTLFEMACYLRFLEQPRRPFPETAMLARDDIREIGVDDHGPADPDFRKMIETWSEAYLKFRELFPD